MKRICLFPGVTAPALLRGAFLAMFLATGLISETQAVGSTIETKSEGPSSLMPCEEALVITDQQAEKRGIEGRVILVDGNCYSVDVPSEGDSSGCSRGRKCAAEHSLCVPGHICKTVNSEGTCFCACMPK